MVVPSVSRSSGALTAQLLIVTRLSAGEGWGSDGTEVVLKALGAYSGMQDFGRSFVSNPAAINLAERLAPFGLRVETFGLRTRISVSESLTRQQRDLLHDLGYNDYVRSPRSKKPSFTSRRSQCRHTGDEYGVSQ